MAVVARNGMLLEFASARLRADRALIQAAVCQNVFAFQFARRCEHRIAGVGLGALLVLVKGISLSYHNGGL